MSELTHPVEGCARGIFGSDRYLMSLVNLCKIVGWIKGVQSESIWNGNKNISDNHLAVSV